MTPSPPDNPDEQAQVSPADETPDNPDEQGQVDDPDSQG